MATPPRMPLTPPFPFLESPFTAGMVPPAPLCLTGGPFVLTAAGGGPSLSVSDSRTATIGSGSSSSSSGSSSSSSNSNATPAPLPAIRMKIAAHRWKEVTEFMPGGIPVVEIRPYNKADGKRYLYVRADLPDGPAPRMTARFRVRRPSSGEWLGYLTPAAMDSLPIAALKTDLRQYDVQIKSNLSLQVSQAVVTRLDGDNIGRCVTPPVTDQLQLVVSMRVPNDGSWRDIARLPFYRVKRRNKRGSGGTASQPCPATDQANKRQCIPPPIGQQGSPLPLPSEESSIMSMLLSGKLFEHTTVEFPPVSYSEHDDHHPHAAHRHLRPIWADDDQ
ncbi:Uncharacterized protein PBTT_06426 [Plasmodiophora brassicae]